MLTSPCARVPHAGEHQPVFCLRNRGNLPPPHFKPPCSAIGPHTYSLCSSQAFWLELRARIHGRDVEAERRVTEEGRRRVTEMIERVKSFRVGGEVSHRMPEALRCAVLKWCMLVIPSCSQRGCLPAQQ
eukprot:2517635-Rhodomonas_salina.1